MFPISQDDKIPYEDKKDGIRYFFRPITGANEQVLYDLFDESKKAKEKTKEEQFKALDNFFDFCLVGWESLTDRAAPQFPENPSKCFRQADKNRLISVCMDLNEIGIVEAKN